MRTKKAKSETKRISIAEYISKQIDITQISQKEIAERMDYNKPNIITMFKQGATKIPLNKVATLARILGLDPIFLFRMAMQEYHPKTWESIEVIIGGHLVTGHERYILEIVREASEGLDAIPQTTEEKEELKALVTKWRDRAEKQVKAEIIEGK